MDVNIDDDDDDDEFFRNLSELKILGMDVSIDDDDDADEFFRNLSEQLKGISLSEPEETMDQWDLNALLEPLPSQAQKRAPPHASSSAAAGVLANLDQLMGPEYRPERVYTQDHSVQFGSNKRIIAVDPTQQLDQCYIAETSQSINPTLQTGRSPSQVLFTVPPASIQFKPVGSLVDTCAAQQQPRKRQRR